MCKCVGKTVQKLGRFVKVSVGQSLGWHQCDDGAGEHNKTVTHPRLTRKIEVGKKKMKKKNEFHPPRRQLLMYT